MGLSRISRVLRRFLLGVSYGCRYSRCITWNLKVYHLHSVSRLPSKGVIHYMREVVLLVSLPPSGGRHFGVHNLMVIGCAFLVTIRH